MPMIFKPSNNLKDFGIKAIDPGYLYIIRSGSQLKLGRSKNRDTRLRQAKTWLPDGEVIGIKPFWNHQSLEKFLQIGLSRFWFSGEWYDFEGDKFEDCFLEEFSAFHDEDINKNSIDFIYLMNSTGMNEFHLEFTKNNTSKSKFQTIESAHSRIRKHRTE